MGQYLTNSDGAYLQDTLALLDSIGTTRTGEILERAVELGSGSDSYAAAWDDLSAEYSQLDFEFMESGEDLAALTTNTLLDTEPTSDSV